MTIAEHMTTDLIRLSVDSRGTLDVDWIPRRGVTITPLSREFL